MRCVTDCFGREVDYVALKIYQMPPVAFFDSARALHLMSVDVHALIPPLDTVVC